MSPASDICRDPRQAPGANPRRDDPAYPLMESTVELARPGGSQSEGVNDSELHDESEGDAAPRISEPRLLAERAREDRCLGSGSGGLV